MTKNFCNSCKLLQAAVPKSGLHSNFKYFFHIFWAPYYSFSTKILILKHIFYFLKSVKWGPLTKIFATPANFNRPLYQSQDFIRTLNIFTYYLSSLLLIQPKKFNFKALFYFHKSVKGVPWQKLFQLLQTLTGYCTKVRTSFEL